MRPDIVPGATLPDYELPDHTHTVRKLSELQGDDPMVLQLSRGHFCPKEHQHHRELVELEPKIKLAYTKIVTVTTDIVIDLNELRDSVGAHWPFLSDTERVIQRDLEIAEYTDPWHNPMVPHTLVLEPGLVVFKVYNGYWYWGRPSAHELRVDLREVTRRMRPDWDPTAPGLREEWEAGDKSKHWPYTPGGVTDLFPEIASVPRADQPS